jgi:heme A synthase
MRMPMTLLAASLVTLTCGSQAFAGPTVVSCGSGQRAVVRSAFVRGEAVTRVSCVDAGYRTATYRASGYRSDRRHRSWQKSALIIGGSTATGAGVGGIVHGKKGALIGAALGGGASSIYEGAKRR